MRAQPRHGRRNTAYSSPHLASAVQRWLSIAKRTISLALWKAPMGFTIAQPILQAARARQKIRSLGEVGHPACQPSAAKRLISPREGCSPPPFTAGERLPPTTGRDGV